MSETFWVRCNKCDTEESFGSLSDAVEAVDAHKSDKGCLFPVETGIEMPDEDTDRETIQ